MRIQAVFFDLDGTLYDRDALVAGLVAEEFDAFQHELTVSKATFVTRVIQLDDHGDRDKREVYRIVGAEYGLASALCDRLHDDFWARYETHSVLDDDVRHTLETLRQRGLKLAVITNGSTEWQQRKLDALGIASWFDAVLISETEGVRKPSPEIFHRALVRCNVEASETLFVGDHPDADIGGALRAGLRAVWKTVPYWPCTHDVVSIRQLSEILPMCGAVSRVPYQLRQATEADLPFMYHAHCRGVGPYITQMRGWDEEKERAYFNGRFSASDCHVILVDRKAVGWLRVEENADHFRLDYIVLAPEHQQRGIGGVIVMDLLERARLRGVPVKLNVLRVNPAKVLYERLGFREVGGDDHRFFMEASPGGQ